MADPRETAHDLRLEAQRVYSAAAAEINDRYRALKAERKRSFDLQYDQVRNELSAARRGRDEALVADLRSRLDELKRRPLPDMADLEEQRLLALSGHDEILRRRLADLAARVRRQEITENFVWSAQLQRHVPLP